MQLGGWRGELSTGLTVGRGYGCGRLTASCSPAVPWAPVRCCLRSALLLSPRLNPLCRQSLKQNADTEDDLLLEAELPFWIEGDDVTVDFGERHLAVTVRNGLHLRRTYWSNK